MTFSFVPDFSDNFVDNSGAILVEISYQAKYLVLAKAMSATINCTGRRQGELPKDSA